MKQLKLFVLLLLLVWSCQTKKEAAPFEGNFSPAQELGELFVDVQLSGLFPDSKTFVDYTPIIEPSEIVALYQNEKNKPNFDLQVFIDEYFLAIPFQATEFPDSQAPLDQHLNNLWPILTREAVADEAPGSLLALPYPYVVPGGRFREIYYWDSYFTMLGLAASGEDILLENMVDNFAHLINTQGHIPNGNRTYYQSRSQPPFFSLMVALFANRPEVASKYLDELLKEYRYWMDGQENLNPGASYRRVVRLPGGAVLNRYWDDETSPRPEAYKEDLELAEHLPEVKRATFYRNIRAAAESGWDFSSRWLEDGENLETAITTDLLPADLNCLMYHLEYTIHTLADFNDQGVLAEEFLQKATLRKSAILDYFWNDELGYFVDYNFRQQQQGNQLTLATAFPLYFKIASQDQANRVAFNLASQMLYEGGLVTTLAETGQQWDYPNGWAPLQWISIQGLQHYEKDGLALDIAERWLSLNNRVYQNTGKMMEKYDVVNSGLEAGGGEYPTQDGFGWTNGVALQIMATYQDKIFLEEVIF